MRSPQTETLTVAESPDALFDAALGVVQNTKGLVILAVHKAGHRLVAREKGKFSNPKFYELRVLGDGDGARLDIVVGTDARSPKALLDGKFNAKALKGFLERLHGALDGSAPAPPSPVDDHFRQGKEEVPWRDPEQDPEIELDGHLLAMYGR